LFNHINPIVRFLYVGILKEMCSQQKDTIYLEQHKFARKKVCDKINYFSV